MIGEGSLQILGSSDARTLVNHGHPPQRQNDNFGFGFSNGRSQMGQEPYNGSISHWKRNHQGLVWTHLNGVSHAHEFFTRSNLVDLPGVSGSTASSPNVHANDRIGFGIGICAMKGHVSLNSESFFTGERLGDTPFCSEAPQTANQNHQ